MCIVFFCQLVTASMIFSPLTLYGAFFSCNFSLLQIEVYILKRKDGNKMLKYHNGVGH